MLNGSDSNRDVDAEFALARALARLKEMGATVMLVSYRPTLMQGGAVKMFVPRAEVLKWLTAPLRAA